MTCPVCCGRGHLEHLAKGVLFCPGCRCELIFDAEGHCTLAQATDATAPGFANRARLIVRDINGAVIDGP